MILGVGADLCRVARIRASVERFGQDWLAEVFTGGELAKCGHRLHDPVAAAIGFAVKEACSKAIGTGFSRGIHRHDFELSISEDRISVALGANAARRVLKCCPAGLDYGFVIAFSSNASWILAHAVLYVGERPEFHHKPGAPLPHGMGIAVVPT